MTTEPIPEKLCTNTLQRNAPTNGSDQPSRPVLHAPTTPCAGIEQLPPEMWARVAHYREAATATSTARTYRGQLRHFAAWCDAHQLPNRLPVPPTLVAAWLAERADDGVSRATIGVALAAVKSAHREAGHAFDANDAVLLATLKGIRRSLIEPSRQMAPLTGAFLTEILIGAGTTDIDIRDAALMSCLYCLALRRSELAGLDYGAFGSGSGVIKLTPETLEVVLHRSKPSPITPTPITVSRAANPLAAAAIERWSTHAGLGDRQPFMRRMLSDGSIGGRITGGGIAVALRNAICRHLMAQGASADAARAASQSYGGHSGRVGFVVSSREAGAPDVAIAAVTRHQDPTMVARYGAQADQLRTAPHNLEGVGV